MSQLKIAVIGIDHRHSYGMLQGMLDAGALCKGFWTVGEPTTYAGFKKRFPDLPRVDDRRQLLDDDEIELILIADIPVLRAERAIEAMRAGKHVMLDKPGCTSFEQLAEIKEAVAETGRIWSVNFSERFEVPAVQKAAELISAGAIGKVVQTIGMGPHRLNAATRPDWFFERDKFGGILTDIGSHQIDQFLFFTGSGNAEIVASSIGNFANPEYPELEDFGEILIKGDQGQGYIRVDWYTPDALPNWGDGRLTVLGTEGYIELRKYVDVDGRPGTDHVFLVNKDICTHIDASDIPLTYFRMLSEDIRNGTETVMTQEHCFTVMELALKAQEMAERRGNLA